MSHFQWAFRLMYLRLDVKVLPTRQQAAAHKPCRLLSSSLSSDCHGTHILTTPRQISRRPHSRTTRPLGRTTGLQLPSRKAPIKGVTGILSIATAQLSTILSCTTLPDPNAYPLCHHRSVVRCLHRMLFAQRTLKQFHMVTMRVPVPRVMKQHSKANKKHPIFSVHREPGQSP